MTNVNGKTAEPETSLARRAEGLLEGLQAGLIEG